MKVIFERFPYRYVNSGVLENGMPDYRIQKAHQYTKRYSDMYLVGQSNATDLQWMIFEYPSG